MDTVLFILAGVAIGSVITYFLTRSAMAAVHTRELSGRDAEVSDLQKELVILQERISARNNSLEEVRKSMLDTFKSAAADALSSNNDKFLSLASTKFEAQSNEAKTTLEQKEKAIKDLLKPVADQMEEYRKKVESYEKDANTNFGRVTELLTGIQATHLNLQKETGALVNALKNPQTRGRWGEITLHNLVEMAGMLGHCDFNEQVYREGEEETVKPDMIINLPDEKHIVVDSKVPLKAFMEAIETTDEKIRNDLFSVHAKSVRNRMNELSKKNYWEQFKNTLDMVVLFIPVESALNAALLTDKDLYQDALSRKIILAAPSTLLVVLRSFALNWQQYSMTVNAKEIMETARELHVRLCKFSEHLGNIGDGLKTALKSYNEAVGSYNSRVVVTGRKLEELGTKSQKENLKNIGTVEGSIRALDTPDKE